MARLASMGAGWAAHSPCLSRPSGALQNPARNVTADAWCWPVVCTELGVAIMCLCTSTWPFAGCCRRRSQSCAPSWCNSATPSVAHTWYDASAYHDLNRPAMGALKMHMQTMASRSMHVCRCRTHWASDLAPCVFLLLSQASTLCKNADVVVPNASFLLVAHLPPQSFLLVVLRPPAECE